MQHSGNASKKLAGVTVIATLTITTARAENIHVVPIQSSTYAGVFSAANDQKAVRLALDEARNS